MLYKASGTHFVGSAPYETPITRPSLLSSPDAPPLLSSPDAPPLFSVPVTHRRSSDSRPRMGRLFLIELEGKAYACKYCKAHVASSSSIVSKSFTCRHGKAYLAEKVVNVSIGEPEERIMMVTGRHIVADICCVGCGSSLGWKYESASEDSQKYKENKCLLYRCRLLGPDGSQYVITDNSDSEGSDNDNI